MSRDKASKTIAASLSPKTKTSSIDSAYHGFMEGKMNVRMQTRALAGHDKDKGRLFLSSYRVNNRAESSMA
jgi:hypothetical protein